MLSFDPEDMRGISLCQDWLREDLAISQWSLARNCFATVLTEQQVNMSRRWHVQSLNPFQHCSPYLTDKHPERPDGDFPCPLYKSHLQNSMVIILEVCTSSIPKPWEEKDQYAEVKRFQFRLKRREWRQMPDRERKRVPDQWSNVFKGSLPQGPLKRARRIFKIWTMHHCSGTPE